MVKDLTANNKCVIASFPSRDLDKNMIMARVWKVLGQCEGAGVKGLNVVCDGCPNNRAYFKLHTFDPEPTETGSCIEDNT